MELIDETKYRFVTRGSSKEKMLYYRDKARELIDENAELRAQIKTLKHNQMEAFRIVFGKGIDQYHNEVIQADEEASRYKLENSMLKERLNNDK